MIDAAGPVANPVEHRPLRIGIDMISAGTAFAPGVGGMVTYYEHLLGCLSELPEVERIVALVPPWNAQLAIPEHPKVKVVRCAGLSRRRPLRVAYEQLALPLLANLHRVDVLLCTVNVAPLLRRRPTVVVLQSLQYYVMADQFTRLRRAYLQWAVPRSLRHADRVITVSDTVRADVSRFVSVDPAKLTTVHHGAPPVRQPPAVTLVRRRPLPSEAPYLLAVSRLYGHKNHTRLIEAFARVIADGSVRHHLVIAGGDADVTAAALAELAARLGIGDRVHCLGSVSDDALSSLYAHASAAAYVSLYETFGHPVLEAFTWGLPLVTSNIGATSEIAGSAARLVDPRDLGSIADGIRDVLLDDAIRDRLRASGRARLTDFSWSRCAQQTLEVLQAAVQNGDLRT